MVANHVASSLRGSNPRHDVGTIRLIERHHTLDCDTSRVNWFDQPYTQLAFSPAFATRTNQTYIHDT